MSDDECSSITSMEVEDLNDYYAQNFSDNEEEHNSDDPESYPIKCLTFQGVEELFDQLTKTVSLKLNLKPALSKMLLHKNNWSADHVISEYTKNDTEFLITSCIHPKFSNEIAVVNNSSDNDLICQVCINNVVNTNVRSLVCGHKFCESCWTQYITLRISEGAGVEISCMEQKCNILALEDFILNMPISNETMLQYKQFAFQSYVKSFDLLRFCTGSNCNTIFRVDTVLAKRVVCPNCNAAFCFKCGMDYHAPTDCVTMKLWIAKCQDDSETANYIKTYTKDCPKCQISIEKNGGCNHMLCYKCKFDFCWICLGDWRLHGSEYYECSRYKENPQSDKTVRAGAGAALKRYLHYYERWENHCRSLKLEKQTVQKIKARIHEKVMDSLGTWIDWQYLLDAAALLAKCRYTLKYTYPYAYYMKHESRRDLFEFQQAQLEAEIENLSWKVERAETTDRGDLENQMYIAEKRRKTLLNDFFQS